MGNYKITFGAILGTLVVVIIGLFFVCSRRPALQDEDFADADVDDSAFRQELMEMLDLTESTSDVGTFEGVDEANSEDTDILTLLDTKAAETEADVTPVRSKSAGDGISEDMFLQIRAAVDRLDGVLWKRNSTADSLQRIIERRKARITELENLVTDTTQKGKAIRQPRRSQPVPRTASTIAPSGSGMGTAFKSKYQQARFQFEARDYKRAIASFEALLTEFPDHSMADNCQYWIGESYFGLKQYPQAALEFQKVFAFNQKDKYDDSQLMIGLAYYRNGEREKARYEFEVFLSNYGNSEYTAIAERYIKRI